MLKDAIRRLNPKGSMKDLAKISGVSVVTLYSINANPNNKKLALPTIEKIYVGSKKLYSEGILPDQYLNNITFNFTHK